MKELVLSRLSTLLGIVFTYTLTMIVYFNFMNRLQSYENAFIYTILGVCIFVYFGSTCEAAQSFKTRLKLKSKYYDSYVKTGRFGK